VTPAPVPVAVLASGTGTNLQALLDALPPGAPARVVRVLSDRREAEALDRARRAGVDAVHLADPSDPASLAAGLEGVRLTVLAGYLKLVPAPVVARFRWRVINIHPALLPGFGGPGMYGERVHAAVLQSGAALSGATVHYVDEQYDRGPIIAQWPVPVRADDTPGALAARVRAVEHRLLPAVVLSLARLGVPERAVRLGPPGDAFASAPQPAVELTHATE
jgi:formyltetrahydrofolate-dependent phosphoribosylglycinamide formyltransferase